MSRARQCWLSSCLLFLAFLSATLLPLPALGSNIACLSSVAASIYNGSDRATSRYDNSTNVPIGYGGALMIFGGEGQAASEGARPLFSGFGRFLAAEGTGIDSVRASYKALGIETSSTSTAASRGYTIYQQDGTLFKFGVTDADFVRMNQSLKMAGPGSYARYTDIMPKYQAHLGEKYLRSLQYNSTGVWPLPGMKGPYPNDFTTQLPVPPQ